MKDILYTRWLLIKKQSISLCLWLFLPLLITIAILSVTESVQGDFTVPVGIVLEEENDSSLALYDELNDTSLITATLMSERKALRQLERHELDSVFVIRENYQSDLEQGSRNNLLEGYYSDRSFAYDIVKESIVSIIQQETGRVNAANTVIQLEQQLNGTANWSVHEITAKSKQIQTKENLLIHQFQYQGERAVADKNEATLNPWVIWAFSTMLITIFVFDWVIKERQQHVSVRFHFMKIPYPKYIVLNVLIYLLLFLITDGITAIVLSSQYGAAIPIINLLSFRLMICLFAFLFVSIWSNVYFMYVAAIIWTFGLMAIYSINLLGDVKWLYFINPLERFLSGEWTIGWLFICLIGTVIWFNREERNDA
ncbi:ABC transporter permease [Gracilibacillus caseinilyticus]|uniref:ABC transporter permease n=1 Tax=Gracilibacillus caseinilyticus TaxID=2932256 RepID=A0ABY4F0C7_9BACI|nr:ABC transporter permease [Gracilibacillus caseinilyticus]UOQ49963.1 ABC transporter permease [Gracilibacillus caseinilyticus]